MWVEPIKRCTQSSNHRCMLTAADLLAMGDDHLTTKPPALSMCDACSLSPGRPAAGCSPRSACGDAGSHPRGMALSSCSCSWMVWWGTCTQTGFRCAQPVGCSWAWVVL